MHSLPGERFENGLRHSMAAAFERTSFGGLTRSVLMSHIRSTGNATTEKKLLLLLRAAGIRGWRRRSSLPGKPDFIFSKAKVAIFVDGCFWHGHSCNRNLTPTKNSSFWTEKIRRNQRRDRQVGRLLRSMGWQVVRIWECRLKSGSSCLARIQRAIDR